MTLTRQYVKLCDLADFEDPLLLEMVRSILPERDPVSHVERKVWEFAMLALFLRDVGKLDDSTHALSVGAGDERIVFWLANRLGRVVATDIYGEGSFSEREAAPSMLDDPRAHAPFAYREDHLEVMWMDACELQFPDHSFDVVFTLSSIEHFGAPGDVSRAAAEIGRVLKPGGYAVVVTDCFVNQHPLDTAAVDFAIRLATLGFKRKLATPRRRGGVLGEVFKPRELRERIIRPSGLRLMQPLDLSLSSRAWEHVQPASPAEWSSEDTPYPLILLQAKRSVFTSVCLVMERPLSP